MSYEDYYAKQKNKSDEVFTKSLSKQNAVMINSSKNKIDDLIKWTNVINDRFEYQIYKNALIQFQLTIQTLNLGFYSNSFFGLRFLLERFLVGILLSTNEMKYRTWEKGGGDISWTNIMDLETGIFSFKFANAFFPELTDDLKHYEGLTRRVYRECSEFVHGNHHTLYKIPEKISYDDDLFKHWHRKSQIIFEVLFFVLNLRYSNFLNKKDILEIEDINIDYLNFIRPIRGLHD